MAVLSIHTCREMFPDNNKIFIWMTINIHTHTFKNTYARYTKIEEGRDHEANIKKRTKASSSLSLSLIMFNYLITSQTRLFLSSPRRIQMTTSIIFGQRGFKTSTSFREHTLVGRLS